MKDPAPVAIVERHQPARATRPVTEPIREEKMMEESEQSQDLTSRRSFLLKGAAVGAASLGAGGLLLEPSEALAKPRPKGGPRGGLTKGDAAILRFLAAAELIETDLWQQYNELAGIQDREVPGGSGSPAYAEAISVLDEDMDQYIHDNTDDEISHAAFINAYLKAHGAEPVNLNKFRKLPSSQATGAQQIGRLTNLMELTVNTSFWTRYRSDSQNPDFGDTLPQAIPDLATGSAPGDPAYRRRPRPARPPAGDRQHGRLPLRLDRAGRYQPLRRARPAGHPFRGATDPAQHRRERDHALPDLAGQSRQRACPDRSHHRAGLPRPQRRRRADPDQPDHARADDLPRSQVPDRLDHPPHGDRRRRHQHRQGLHQRRPLHRPISGVLRRHHGAGTGRGRGPTRVVSDVRQGDRLHGVPHAGVSAGASVGSEREP